MIERLLAAEGALERDELDHAQRLFGGVVEADPRNAIAVVGLARVLARRGDTEAARELVAHALEIDPDEAAAQRLLEDLDRGPERAPDGPLAVPAAPPGVQGSAPSIPAVPVAGESERATGGLLGRLRRLFRRD